MKPQYSFYHIKNPQIDDKVFLEPCCSIVDAVLTEYANHIQTPHITITQESNPHKCIETMRIGWYTYSSYHIGVSIDWDTIQWVTDTFISQYRSNCIHELHHSIRRNDPWYGETFWEVLVSEWLACLSEMEANPWHTIAYIQTSKDELQKLITAGCKQEDNYNHREWYFGTWNLPNWAWYKLWYYLLNEYSKQTKRTARDLLHVDGKEIFQSLIIQKILTEK